MADLRSVVFDLDGLVFNTEDVFIEATNRFLAPFGKTYTRELRAKMMGQPSGVSTKILKETLNLELPVSQIISGVDEHFVGVMEEIIAFMPGFESLITRLANEGITCAICTSSSSSYASSLLTRFQVIHHFKTIVGGEHVRHGKPAPDAYLLVAKRLGHPPSRMMVLEDSANGCRAAHAAGAFTVAVPAKHTLGQDYGPVDLTANTLGDPRILVALGLE